MNQPTAQLTEKELLQIIDKNRALDATYKLIEIILETPDYKEMTLKIANTIPLAMGYELGIFLQVDHQRSRLIKEAISDTIGDDKKAEELLEKINISLGYEDNVSIKAVKEIRQYVLESLYDVVKPALTKSEADDVQKRLDIKTFIITPLLARGRTIGVMIVGTAKEPTEITNFEKEMLVKFCENAGIALENSRLYSNLKNAKEDLNKAYENLKVLNKLKDEFLSVASHELRTPMTIDKSYLWMLEKDESGKLGKKQKEYLEKAASGTQRMIDLINDMLDISKFEQKKIQFRFEHAELCSLISQVVSNFELKIKEKNLDVTVDKNCSEVYVTVDVEKTKEILINLIDNALKFTKKGSVNIGIDEEEDFVKIWIKDTGSGIDPKDLPKLFHKFARIDNSYTIATESGGTGLGLYIVKLYAEGMGGQVGAFSKGAEQGSTFWFTLPKDKIKKFGEIGGIQDLNLKKI